MAIKRRDSLTRRSWLTKMGVTAAGIASLPIVTAEENVLKMFKEGLRYRRKYDWGLDKWLEYVEELGVKYGNSQENQASTQVIAGFEPGDLTLTVTYYTLSAHPPYPGYDQIELHWEFDNSGVDDTYTGEPKDLVKIGYQPTHFSKPPELDGDRWYEYGPDTSSPGVDAISSGGILGEWNGLYIDWGGVPITDGETGGDMGLQDHMSVYIDPSNEHSYDELTIYFAYSMLYDSAELAGPNFSTDGVIGYGIENERDSWTVNVAYEAADIVDGKEYTP